jgi:acetyl esterase/lipase
LGATLLISPRPAALLVRRLFAVGGAQTKAVLDRHAPTGVEVLVDEPYGVEDDLLLDLARPLSSRDRLPLVLWVHGGGWVGGSKDELTGWFTSIASEGYVVGGPRYSLAPEHRYPTPLRQMMQALDYLLGDAERFGIDPSRIVIGGDSAGAQIAAQLGALVTTPGYAEEVGVMPTIDPQQLRGLVLACGPYDLDLLARASTPIGRRLVRAILWAYSGRRRFLDDRTFATWSVTNHLTAAFPVALITVGNADPLTSHSELLAERLAAAGAEYETCFWSDDHQPPLGHEYQFELDGEAGRRFFASMLAFLERRCR